MFRPPPDIHLIGFPVEEEGLTMTSDQQNYPPQRPQQQQPQPPLPPHQTPPARSGGWGKALIGGVVGLLVAGLIVGAGILAGLVKIGAGGSSASGVNEGSGYKSPEEAAVAYVEAYRDKDPSAMASVFAVESFAKDCDMANYPKLIGMFTFEQNPCPLPSDDPAGHELNVQDRQARVAMVVGFTFASFMYPEEAARTGGLDEAEIEELSKKTKENLAKYQPGSIENIRALEDVTEHSDSLTAEQLEAMLKSMEASMSGEELRAAVVTFDLDGEQWSFAGLFASFGDRWYLMQPGGPVSNLGGSGDQTASRTGFQRLG